MVILCIQCIVENSAQADKRKRHADRPAATVIDGKALCAEHLRA